MAAMHYTFQGLTVYLRMLGRPVPATYGPSADEMWVGADATTSAEAATRQ